MGRDGFVNAKSGWERGLRRRKGFSRGKEVSFMTKALMRVRALNV